MHQSSRATGPRSWRAPRTPRQPYRQTPATPRHSQSSSWQTPTYRGTGSSSKLQLNESRRKICQKSPFWHENFDLPQHRKEWKEGEARREQAAIDRTRTEQTEKTNLEKETGEPFPPPRPLRPFFDDKPLLASPDASFSAVLTHKTIFCTTWRPAKEDVAPWPNRHEMDYEGDSRLAPTACTVVSSRYRACIFSKPWYNPLGVNWEDVYFRMLRVEELEFTDAVTDAVDEEGRHAIGGALMAALDPEDQWV
ncbi:hypothetical protein B0A54_14735 [Friedmanniomyces endolithicus]|uniref:Uncharacterized protein n=1 Tax=Friedmanniomyces endolithicus TaxID=329885 RepID=A0A4U0UCP0_9PEZI|nr:hypothetical protein LTS09_007675 [Friedmanniomyces endolithicus]TKA33074.1 hypothetical protein B0A54_14735 [Friedmanniomyces endolithicus]